MLPVRLEALGIDPTAGSAPLRFAVGVHGEYRPPGSASGVVDAMAEPVTFDPIAPGIDIRPVDGEEPDPGLLLRPADDGTVLRDTGDEPVLVVLGLRRSRMTGRGPVRSVEGGRQNGPLGGVSCPILGGAARFCTTSTREGDHDRVADSGVVPLQRVTFARAASGPHDERTSAHAPCGHPG